VAWRWAKVLTLRDRPHLPLKLDEPLLQSASVLAHQLEQSAERHTSQHPKGRQDLRDAYAIFGGDQPRQRGILEAWLRGAADAVAVLVADAVATAQAPLRELTAWIHANESAGPLVVPVKSVSRPGRAPRRHSLRSQHADEGCT
jgi:hypothetical protein